MTREKYIRDPLYEDFIVLRPPYLDVVEQPFFQRYRRIKQLGLADLVYPGADHSRFQHALGAFHLAGLVVERLRHRGVAITPEEEEAFLLASLLHDLGHGPFSHSLEHALIPVRHEVLSYALIRYKLTPLLGQETADRVVRMLRDPRPRTFFHELLDGQLDVDRMDYLRRDSFFCGIPHGQIDVVRILQTLTVVEQEGEEVLAVEEKGMQAVEAYLIARYLMYWAVYYHRTNLAAQALLESVFLRVRHRRAEGDPPFLTPAFYRFLEAVDALRDQEDFPDELLDAFLLLDDSDVWVSLKIWQEDPDPVLSDLSRRFLERRLPRAFPDPDAQTVMDLQARLEVRGLPTQYYLREKRPSDVGYAYYAPGRARPIRILTRGGEILEIAQALPTDSLKALSRPVERRYLFLLAREVH